MNLDKFRARIEREMTEFDNDLKKMKLENLPQILKSNDISIPLISEIS